MAEPREAAVHGPPFRDAIGYCARCGEGAAEPCTTFAGDPPDTKLYMESELFVAGALSTMPMFENHHPAHALPYARRALEALTEWEPADG